RSMLRPASNWGRVSNSTPTCAGSTRASTTRPSSALNSPATRSDCRTLRAPMPCRRALTSISWPPTGCRCSAAMAPPRYMPGSTTCSTTIRPTSRAPTAAGTTCCSILWAACSRPGCGSPIEARKGGRVSVNPPPKSRLQHRRGPKPAARPAGRGAGVGIERLLYGGFTVDRSDRHLSNYHRSAAQSEADDDCFRTTRALVVAARRWRKLANDRMKPLKQTMARWETLYLVAYSEAELNQSQLARLIGVQGPTMIRMLDGLAREGLIERQQSHHDLRVTINRITDEGRAVI